MRTTTRWATFAIAAILGLVGSGTVRRWQGKELKVDRVETKRLIVSDAETGLQAELGPRGNEMVFVIRDRDGKERVALGVSEALSYLALFAPDGRRTVLRNNSAGESELALSVDAKGPKVAIAAAGGDHGILIRDREGEQRLWVGCRATGTAGAYTRSPGDTATASMHTEAGGTARIRLADPAGDRAVLSVADGAASLTLSDGEHRPRLVATTPKEGMPSIVLRDEGNAVVWTTDPGQPPSEPGHRKDR